MVEDAGVADCARTTSLDGDHVLQVQAARSSNVLGHMHEKQAADRDIVPLVAAIQAGKLPG